MPSMREIINFEDAVRKACETTGQVTLATGFYPRKNLRYRRPRSRSERSALYRAVYYAVEEARKTGFITKTKDGYEMRW